MKFYKIIKIYLNNIFHEFELLNVDSMTYKEQIQNKNILNIGTIYYDNRNKKFSGGGNSYPERGKINLIGDIQEIYQYQGIDTPTEFITEESTEHDYYTKLETNNLLDKKQNKLIAGENITIDKETNTISATGGKTDLTDYYKKEEVDKKLEDTKALFPIAFSMNAIGQEIPNLETTNKTVAGAINEINKKQPSPSIPQWKEVGTKVNINHIKYTFKSNTKYKIYYNFESQTSSKKFAFMCKEFLYGELNPDIQSLYWDKVNDRIIISLQMQNYTIAIVSDPTRFGQLLKLEELQE